MCRSPSRWAALVLAPLACCVGLVAETALGQGPPSDFDAARADLPAGSVSFSDGSVGFSDGSVAFSTGSTAFPTGTIAQPERSGRELRFQLMADLLFDFDRADLRPEAEGVLHDVVSRIQAETKRPMLRIEGHTDAKGTEQYNQDLSVRRATSVKNWLVRATKLPAKRISTAGFGKTQPVAPNEKPDGADDAEGRQRNRRVEIVVTDRP